MDQELYDTLLSLEHEAQHYLKTGEVRPADGSPDVMVRVLPSDHSGEVNLITVHDDNQIVVKPINIQTTCTTKIIHVVNMVNLKTVTNPDLKNRLMLGVQSIEAVDHSNVTRLAACYDNHKKNKRPGWTYTRLTRCASTDNLGTRHLAYFHDLFKQALHHCESDTDYILYTNLDCMITPNMYENILSSGSPVIELHRRDTRESSDLHKIFTSPYTIKQTGVDGFAIQAAMYHEFVEKMFPDMLIGEPHWDTTLSNLFANNKTSTKDSRCMYHVIHEQAWDVNNLSPGGLYNRQHMHNCIEYGLIEDKHIQFSGDSLEVVINYESDETTPQVNKLVTSLSNKEVLIVNVLPIDHPKPSRLNPRFINIQTVHLDHTQQHVDQTNALINKVVLTNPWYSTYNIHIHKQHKKTLEPDMIIHYNNFEPMNIYEHTNQHLSCYMNDQGLLQDCNIKQHD